ncbi:hypothetical protein PRIPAC_90219 [Pristionchus pacificus]|uniref:Uncharacterized protein n=1 Tax=Pristionchus pacificus TaxID=54126 RepID=A0A2A6CTP8_PRIPA|nr:hypothetical protein PRIPAC_90219 [Pristionchus pacificus]|eukprot:PDM81427.1 hypothetical protein PRIPAC_35303 [Pristionchus pacificus]
MNAIVSSILRKLRKAIQGERRRILIEDGKGKRKDSKKGFICIGADVVIGDDSSFLVLSLRSFRLYFLRFIMPYEAGRALLFEKMQFELNVEGYLKQSGDNYCNPYRVHA